MSDEVLHGQLDSYASLRGLERDRIKSLVIRRVSELSVAGGRLCKRSRGLDAVFQSAIQNLETILHSSEALHVLTVSIYRAIKSVSPLEGRSLSSALTMATSTQTVLRSSASRVLDLLVGCVRIEVRSLCDDSLSPGLLCRHPLSWGAQTREERALQTRMLSLLDVFLTALLASPLASKPCRSLLVNLVWNAAVDALLHEVLHRSPLIDEHGAQLLSQTLNMLAAGWAASAKTRLRINPTEIMLANADVWLRSRTLIALLTAVRHRVPVIAIEGMAEEERQRWMQLLRPRGGASRLITWLLAGRRRASVAADLALDMHAL